MNKNITGLLGFGLIVGVILLSTTLYTVGEGQQAVITQFGEPIGKPVTESGLHLKSPLQTVNYFDKKILSWEGAAEELTTRDKRFIWVDTTARWRINDPLKFMQSVGTDERAAQALLDDIIDGATRDAISNLVLVESIRNSNRLINEIEQQEKNPADAGFDTSDVSLEKVKVGRENLTRSILERSSKIILTYGIELVDMRIKRINYVSKVQKKVFERMISERKRAAEQFRAEGQAKKAEIEGRVKKEMAEIQSQAYKKSQEIKGKADAQAIRIYAEAYNKDPEFYAFMKTLDTYKKTINNDTVLILSTDSDFYKYLKSIHSKNVENIKP